MADVSFPGANGALTVARRIGKRFQVDGARFRVTLYMTLRVLRTLRYNIGELIRPENARYQRLFLLPKGAASCSRSLHGLTLLDLANLYFPELIFVKTRRRRRRNLPQ